MLMTLNEVSEKFRIDIEKLKFYEDNRLLEFNSSTNGIPDYTENELRRIGIIHSLQKAGADIPLIRQYLTLTNDSADQKEEKIRILRKQRCKLLEEIHSKQQSLDELDYMISEIRKEVF